jgi:hypothetical protein
MILSAKGTKDPRHMEKQTRAAHQSARGFEGVAYNRSTIVAIPMPPPTHSVARP